MTKRKMLLCAAVLTVAVGVAMLFNKPTDAPKSEAAVGVSSTAKLPVVAATTAKPSVTPAVSCTNQTPTVRGTLPYVLTSAKPFQKTLRLAVEAMGTRTVCSISRNELLIEATPEVCARLAADSRFEEVAEFVSSSKIQPELAAMIAGGAKSVDVSLVAISDADRELVISCLEQGGGEMLQGCINEGDTIRAKLPADLVATLATRGDVRWMEKFEYPKLMNNLAIQPDAMNITNVWDLSRGLGLTGAGQNISTSDSGIDTGDTSTMHQDLCHRVKDMKLVRNEDGEVIVTTTDQSGHGTHTAGSIVGDGTMSTNWIRGTAHAANLYAWFCGAPNLKNIYTPSTAELLFTADGAWTNFIHSASWGSAVNGKYDEECVDIDTYVWNHAEYLPVFSAGNEGCDRTGTEIYSQTIGSPAASKNVLTVGATQSSREGHDGGWGNGDVTKTVCFSSRGPCRDGRTKPDIAAPGSGILSTRSSASEDILYGVCTENANYLYCSGTSMSCPLTAGAVALVRQWLVEKKGFVDEDGKRPTAALMKAVIMGGAKGAATPNNDQGWGRVDLANTLAPTNGCAVKLIDRIPFDEGFVTNIVIETTNAAPLDVQLVWVDYPGSASANQAAPKLVNNIDLTVEARVLGEPAVRYGNGGNEPDALNNAESVRIANAQPTKYVITVDCKTILHDYTEGGAAALYIRGAFDPEAKPTVPAYVRIKERDLSFMRLDKALEEVQDGETVEILDWVSLDKSVMLTNSCTICATNADPSASYVARSSAAQLNIADGAQVMLSNVVFSAATDALVVVEDGGCLKLGSAVSLGLDADHVAISTVRENGFELAGSLSDKILFRCSAATSQTQMFGTYSCDYLTASNSALMIVCADDEDREMRGYAQPLSDRLVWKRVALPIEDAAGYFVDADGNTNTYYRMAKALKEFQECYALGVASEFIVRKHGEFGLSFRGDVAVGMPLVFRGEGDERPVLTVASTAGFYIPDGGSLTVSNLVFTGYEAPLSGGTFIEVDGGDLTLDDGAMLDGIVGRAYHCSGVVDLFAGTVTMLDGSGIVNCAAEGEVARGGAIYMECTDGSYKCELNISGGTITNCYAGSVGGAVFVAADEKRRGDIRLKGRMMISDNFAGATTDGNDDFYIERADEVPFFKLFGEAEGTVGIRYSSSAAFGNAEDDAFMTNAVGAVSRDTLDVFFNDTDASLEAVTNANGMLVWAKRIVDGQCRPGEPVVVLLIDADGKTNRYVSVARAFEYMGTNSPYVVEMQTNDCLMASVGVPAGRDVTLRSAADVDAELARGGDFGITVPACTSLTLANIVMCRDESVAAGPVLNALVTVEGGALTLASGACISNILGSSSRDAGAIAVYGGGTVAMESGSRISGCQNTNNYDMVFENGTNYGCGGGILVDDGTARLGGGEIAGCVAVRGGGVYLCNASKAYISGDMRIKGNCCLSTNGVRSAGNVFATDQATVYLDGVLTEKIGAGGMPWLTKDPNLVAQVSYAWTNAIESFVSSATNFVHDVSGEVGVAVTNGTRALVVWCGAVNGGVYTNTSDGVEYRPIAAVPLAELLPPLDSASAIAGELTKLADATVADEIKTLDAYNDFCTWAASVEDGKEAVAASGRAYVSYEFGTTKLFEHDPAVEIAEIENADGGLTVSVVVKDGEDPIAVASAKVKEMFEATGDAGDWNAKLDLTVTDLTKSNASEVRFTVKPAGNPAKAFIRLKY